MCYVFNQPSIESLACVTGGSTLGLFAVLIGVVKAASVDAVHISTSFSIMRYNLETSLCAAGCVGDCGAVWFTSHDGPHSLGANLSKSAYAVFVPQLTFNLLIPIMNAQWKPAHKVSRPSAVLSLHRMTKVTNLLSSLICFITISMAWPDRGICPTFFVSSYSRKWLH